jgi:cystathionine beta-synthase
VAVMKKFDIENIPVMRDDDPIGSVSEAGLFQKVFSDPAIRDTLVSAVMEPAYPIVDFSTPVERLSHLITRENGAVLAKDETGAFHILTKYDIIQSFAK